MRFIVFLLAFVCAAASTAQTDPVLKTYDRYLKKEIADGQLAGAVAVVVKDGKVLHRRAYGYSDVENETAMDTGAVFHIMSMTKPVISLAAMMLWEEGKFSIGAPISNYLAGFENLKVARDVNLGLESPQGAANSVPTIRQLLSHTAGFSHGLGGTRLDDEFARAMYFSPHADLAARVKRMTEFPLVAQPGTRWAYSASPDVIALLIEKMSGQSVDQFLRERIFEPLGMHDTGYNMTDTQAARMPKLYKSVDGKMVNDPMQMPASGHTVFGGSHGLLSTAADYGKFLQMILDGGVTPAGKRLVRASTLRIMARDQTGGVGFTERDDFGYGFAVAKATPADRTDNRGRMSWSGAYTTFFLVDPAERLYAILLTQTSPYTGRYGETLREHVYRAVLR